jgi:hypothetical protein
VSSTNRGGQRSASDYYVTPTAPVETFLRAWAQDLGPLTQTFRRIFDPCAGGKMVDSKVTQGMTYPEVLASCAPLFSPSWNGRTETMDIRPDSPADIIRDYLDSSPGQRPDLIISNPPFALAAEFIRKALRDVRSGGFVVFLLRLNYFGGVTEKPKLWAEVGLPLRAYVHAKRMSFTANGKQDSIEYAHMVWRSGIVATETILKVI